jgi:uncharacterized membrane-anchored protein
MIKHACLTIALSFASAAVTAQDGDQWMTGEEAQRYIEEFESRLSFQTGSIVIGDGLATLQLPDGARFLDKSQARWVLESEWGNPPDDLVLGLVVPPGERLPLGWAIVVAFEEMGYVSDDDAMSIDYDDLLIQMQQDTSDSNDARVQQGYPAIDLIGWAEAPTYTPAYNKLYWAALLRFTGDEYVTLNYDVRLLGRRGVLSMMAVADQTDLPQVREMCKGVAMGASFNAGHRYEEFDSNIDEVAAYGIGGLVAGKVLAKAGILKLLLKPLIVVGAIVAAVIGKVVLGRN